MAFGDGFRRLSPSHRERIRPVLEQPREYVLLSIRGLAARLGSDPATALRIVRGMGFASYREFQHHLHELSILRATTLDVMRSSLSRRADIPAHVRASLDCDRKNLEVLRHSLDFRRLTALAKRLHEARRILILGGDLATSLVSYLEYNLAALGLPALTGTSTGRVVHTVRSIGKRDLVIAISFHRGLRQTVEGLAQSRRNGAYCVGVCDTFVSPIARLAHEVFHCSVESPVFGASYVAPIALLNVLVVACANYRRRRTLELLKEADREQRTGFRWYRED